MSNFTKIRPIFDLLSCDIVSLRLLHFLTLLWTGPRRSPAAIPCGNWLLTYNARFLRLDLLERHFRALMPYLVCFHGKLLCGLVTKSRTKSTTKPGTVPCRIYSEKHHIQRGSATWYFQKCAAWNRSSSFTVCPERWNHRRTVWIWERVIASPSAIRLLLIDVVGAIGKRKTARVAIGAKVKGKLSHGRPFKELG